MQYEVCTTVPVHSIPTMQIGKSRKDLPSIFTDHRFPKRTILS
jgi:hypothetical protein